MSASAVTQKPAKNQQVTSKPANQPAIARDEKETSASASAAGGLNLNVFGALSGAFSGKSKKEQRDDGTEIEQKEQRAGVKGAGGANASAAGAAHAEARGKEMRERIMAGEDE